MMNTYVTLEQVVGRFMHKVYAWMAVGLLITASTSYFLFSQPSILKIILASQFNFIILVCAQMGIIIYLGAKMHSMSFNAAVFGFSLYSFLVGITLTPIFLVYTMHSIVQVFITTAGMFASMAIYGYFTKKDLSGLGNILIMGLFGLIIAHLVNWFLISSQFDYLISLFGVAIFTALTAYDVQKIKGLFTELLYSDSHEVEVLGNKVALLGAITLYLDFLNLFLYLLRLMGKKRR